MRLLRICLTLGYFATFLLDAVSARKKKATRATSPFVSYAVRYDNYSTFVAVSSNKLLGKLMDTDVLVWTITAHTLSPSDIDFEHVLEGKVGDSVLKGVDWVVEGGPLCFLLDVSKLGGTQEKGRIISWNSYSFSFHLQVFRNGKKMKKSTTLELPPRSPSTQKINVADSFERAAQHDDNGRAGLFYWDSRGRDLHRVIQNLNVKMIRFANNLKVDPLEARKILGLKGKKKLAEALFMYRRLFEHESDIALRASYTELARNLLFPVVNTLEYHDLATLDPKTFQEDSTSYMKVHNIMRMWGFDDSFYLAQMLKVKGLIEGHLHTRAVHNKMAFLFYYRSLGWDFPWTFDELLLGDNFQIGQHQEGTSMDQQRRYFITHELMYLDEMNSFHLLGPEDHEYLAATMPMWIPQWLHYQDFLSEVLWTMAYVRLHLTPHYLWGMLHTINAISKEGKYGDYVGLGGMGEGRRKDINLYLHTTEVTAIALNECRTREARPPLPRTEESVSPAVDQAVQATSKGGKEEL